MRLFQHQQNRIHTAQRHLIHAPLHVSLIHLCRLYHSGDWMERLTLANYVGGPAQCVNYWNLKLRLSNTQKTTGETH